MKVDRQDRAAKGIRFSISDNGRELAHAYLYVLTNDLHKAANDAIEIRADEVRVCQSHIESEGDGAKPSLLR